MRRELQQHPEPRSELTRCVPSPVQPRVGLVSRRLLRRTQEEPMSKCQAHVGRGWDVLETRFTFPFPAPPLPDSTCLFWEHP